MSFKYTSKLKELGHVQFSNVDKVSRASERPVRLCNYMDVYANDYVTADLPFMEATATSSEILRFSLEKGDVLITKDSETPFDIGIPSVIDFDPKNLLCGYHLAMIRPHLKINSVFLAKQLETDRVRTHFLKRANGSTRYGLGADAILNLEIHFPDLPEQSKIAEVLTMIDEAIMRVEQSITKKSAIKAGLMQELLTKGIDLEGQIRDEATHEFKDSPSGRIPVEWAVCQLGDELELVKEKYDPRREKNDAICINLDCIEAQTGKLLSVGSAQENLSLKVRYQAGDILYCKLRPYLKKHFKCKEAGVCTSEFLVFRPNHAIDSAFLYQVISDPNFTMYNVSASYGTKMPRTSWSIASKFILGLPPRDERKKISALLDTQDKLLTANERKLAKLNKLKRGLTAELLTGDTSVAPLLNEIAS